MASPQYQSARIMFLWIVIGFLLCVVGILISTWSVLFTMRKMHLSFRCFFQTRLKNNEYFLRPDDALGAKLLSYYFWAFFRNKHLFSMRLRFFTFCLIMSLKQALSSILNLYQPMCFDSISIYASFSYYPVSSFGQSERGLQIPIENWSPKI